MNPIVNTTGLAVYRYTVPIDHRWHDFQLNGHPLHVAIAEDLHAVDFWAYGGPITIATSARRFRVFGTGKALPEHPVRHWGAAVAAYPGGRGVWHLIESGQYAGQHDTGDPS